MKGKKIITILIIINLILVGLIYNLISKVNVYNKKQVIKEMSQTEYENSITSLNVSHEEFANYIETSKINLAQAITNAGVSTNTDSTFETMISNIENIFNERTKLDETVAATADNISEGKQAYVNGQLVTGTGADNEAYGQKIIYLGTDKSYDIKTLYPDIDYTKLTVDNFIVESLSSGAWVQNKQNAEGSVCHGQANYDFSKKYENGILTISSVTTVRVDFYSSVYANGVSPTKAYLYY